MLVVVILFFLLKDSYKALTNKDGSTSIWMDFIFLDMIFVIMTGIIVALKDSMYGRVAVAILIMYIFFELRDRRL